MKASYRIALLLALAATFPASSPIFAQPSTGQTSVLPAKFGAWIKGPCVDKPPASLLAGEAGDRHGAASCTYSQGTAQVAVWSEEFRDPSAAYEVYTAMLRPGMNATTVGELTALADDQLIAQVGDRVVTISNQRAVAVRDLKSLLSTIDARADHTPLPPIRAYLPIEGMIQGTQRYALGPEGFRSAVSSVGQGKYAKLLNEIGFQSGAEAMMASYLAKGHKTQTLLLLDYPTPQLAEQHLRHIQAALSAEPELAGTTVERKASLLSLVLSPASDLLAAELRNEINYGTQVTWNEPSHTLTDPPWLVVVKNIFLGTLAFCGLALVLGLAFGGIRVITKRLLPGKVFDRPEDMEVLQLGLSGKRIDPRDFY